MKISFNPQRAFAKPIRNNVTSCPTFVGNTKPQRDSVSFTAMAEGLFTQPEYKRGISNTTFVNDLKQDEQIVLGDKITVEGNVVSYKEGVKAGHNFKAGYVFAQKDIDLGFNANINNYIFSEQGNVKLGINAKASGIKHLTRNLDINTIGDIEIISFIETNFTPNDREFILRSENGQGSKIYLPERLSLTIKTPSGNPEILESFSFRRKPSPITGKSERHMTSTEIKKQISVEKI